MKNKSLIQPVCKIIIDKEALIIGNRHIYLVLITHEYIKENSAACFLSKSK